MENGDTLLECQQQVCRLPTKETTDRENLSTAGNPEAGNHPTWIYPRAAKVIVRCQEIASMEFIFKIFLVEFD
jgi:hypothetical protein